MAERELGTRVRWPIPLGQAPPAGAEADAIETALPADWADEIADEGQRRLVVGLVRLMERRDAALRARIKRLEDALLSPPPPLGGQQ